MIYIGFCIENLVLIILLDALIIAGKKIINYKYQNRLKQNDLYIFGYSYVLRIIRSYNNFSLIHSSPLLLSSLINDNKVTLNLIASNQFNENQLIFVIKLLKNLSSVREFINILYMKIFRKLYDKLDNSQEGSFVLENIRIQDHILNQFLQISSDKNI